MELAESVLSSLSLFEPLRADELGRVARRFEVTALAEGERLSFDDGRLLVVLRGAVSLEVAFASSSVRSALQVGDRHGEVGLLTDHRRPFTIVAPAAAMVATLDRVGLDAILQEFPAVALPLAEELAHELRVRNDVVRQILELHAEQLTGKQLEAALDERRRALVGRGAHVSRLSPRAIFRRLITERGAEPPFWMLVGFLVSLSGARLGVALILKYGLEKRLFALHQSGLDPNPMHVHHFNYGLVLIGVAGLAALFPSGRRALRLLAFAFGAGCGLVFDEFALFWNLNPEYAQGLSLIAAAMMGVVFLQLIYFRRFWVALTRRAWFMLGGGR